MAKQRAGGGLLALAVLVLVVVLGVVMLTNKSQAPDTEVVVTDNWEEGISTLGGEIVFVEGSVEYKTLDGEWTRASRGQVLNEGDSVEVVGDGRAIINLDDGSVLRLNADTTITLVSMDPEHMVIANDGGEVYSRVIQSDRVFEVTTGGVTYESLGTAYSTTNNEGEKGVKVYHSSVKVSDVEGDVVVEEGQQYFIEFTEDPELEQALADIPEEDFEQEFVTWNKEEDSKVFANELGVFGEEKDEEEEEDEDKVEEETKDEVEDVSGITLKYLGNGSVSWTSTGYSAKGYKLIWSKNGSPTYPLRSGDKYKYYSSSSASSGTVHAFDGSGTYYIRVCEYLGGSCGTYSNQVQATFEAAEEKEEPKEETTSDVSSISASVSGTTVNWTANGNSEKGFKIVWSKNSGPTYPLRSGDKYKYLSSPGASSVTLNDFDGPGTYYVRVCEYLGGACGVYSNEVTMTFEAEEEPEAGVTNLGISGNGSVVSWNVSGYSPKGFKVVYSKNGSPVYPTRDGDKYIYLSSPDARSTSLTAFDGPGTYYVRVCEYLGGACGMYSNQISVELE